MPPSPTLSSRPKRSEVEGPVVCPITNRFLLIAKRGYRIDSQRAARGNVRRSKSNYPQHQGNANERGWIGRSNPKEEAGKKPRGRQRPSDPDDNSETSQASTLTQYQPQDVAALRADRHANTNFLRARGYKEGDHTIKPDGYQEKRRQCEETNESKQKSLIRGPSAQLLVKRREFDRSVWSKFAEDVTRC